MREAKWGSKVEIINSKEEVIDSGWFLEYDENTDMNWVNVFGKDVAYSSDEYTVRVPEVKSPFKTYSLPEALNFAKNGVAPTNMLYTPNDKIWKVVPNNTGDWKASWKFILIEN